MTHSHGMSPARREAEREAQNAIDLVKQDIRCSRAILVILRDKHLGVHPHAPLTCHQADIVIGAIKSLSVIICELEQLLEHLPNKF